MKSVYYGFHGIFLPFGAIKNVHPRRVFFFIGNSYEGKTAPTCAGAVRISLFNYLVKYIAPNLVTLVRILTLNLEQLTDGYEVVTLVL